MKTALVFEIEGNIRAAGFRTALWRLAAEEGFTGWVGSSKGKTILHLEGEENDIKTFMGALSGRVPKNCRIHSIKVVARETPSHGKRPNRPSFRLIDPPGMDDDSWMPPPPDLATCPECGKAIFDKSNKRFAYPFTSCRSCGPGFSILQQAPFERCKTTMSAFPPCNKCKKDMATPSESGLYRAETLSCPECGPQLFITGRDGQQIIMESPLLAAREALAEGKILAVRSTGGYRIVANAFNRQTMETLRRRKRKTPQKPFAVMARDIATVKAYCECPREAEELLRSQAAPIVVLRLRPAAEFPMPLPTDLIAPDGPTLGIMLPDSPLSKLLFERSLDEDPTGAFDMLVATRGDRGGELTAITNEDAIEKLSGIADLFLCHDREINIRCDDSVCAIRNGAAQVWRLGRGLAPVAVHLRRRLRRPALAMGSDFKCALAMGSRKIILPSPHIGNLDATGAIESARDFASLLPSMMDTAPEVIAVDIDHEMRSSAEGAKLAAKWGVPLIKVQHHFAHALSCMAENGLESALALVFDGAGAGNDGTIWGAELLEVSYSGFRRLASFAPAPMPGKDSAVSRPTRLLIGRFQSSNVNISDAWLERLGVDSSEASIWIKQSAQRTNAPLCHSAGRLFDTVSVMLGLAPEFISYDGQTAMRLEYAALKGDPSHPAPDEIAKKYDFTFKEISGFGLVDWTPMFKSFETPPVIAPEDMPKHAVAFHCAVAKAAAKMVQFGADKSDCRDVLLSGGVFTNRLLCELVPDAIAMLGLNVHMHRKLPPNDGGVAVGQALFAGMNVN